MRANTAAAEVRHKILRKMREIESGHTKWTDTGTWEALRTYIKGMAKRASAKKGGLGRN